MCEGFDLSHVSSGQKYRRSLGSPQSQSKSGFRISTKGSTHIRTEGISHCLTTHTLLSYLESIGSSSWLYPEELTQIILKVLREQANQETPIALSKGRLVKAAFVRADKVVFPTLFLSPSGH